MSTERFISFFQTQERIMKNIKRIASPVMQQYGLRGVHTACFLALRSNPNGLTVTEISKECFMDKALASRLVKELISGDYIVATSDSGEKNYNKRYILTVKSRKIMLELNCMIGNYVSEAGQNIRAQDLDTFYRVLSELDRNIELIGKSQAN
jgi:DNA-binding MarR family transcriptional regulator